MSTTNSRDIVVVGSLNVDLVTRVARLPAPGETVTAREFATYRGGKGANQAYAAARLGGRVRMIGRVGADAHAEDLRGSLRAIGVDVSGVTTDEQSPSGTAFITIDAAGQNSIVIVPGANGTFTAERLSRSREIIARADVLLLQFETPMETVIHAATLAKEAGAVVVLDPAPARDVPGELLLLVDYITPNETELAALVGGGNNSSRPDGGRESADDEDDDDTAVAREGARLLRARGARNVIVKMGAAGALYSGEVGRHWPAVPVEATDTTAAGDCFNAAFAVALAEGMAPDGAGRFAVAAASLSVTRRGAQAGMPSRAEVEQFIKAEGL